LHRHFDGAFFYRVSFHSGGQVWALSALLATPHANYYGPSTTSSRAAWNLVGVG
jgi:hypothetical protein